MNLGEITDFVCGKVGQVDANSKALCNGFVQARYRMIFDSYSWKDSEHLVFTNTSDSVDFFALPSELEQVTSIRCGGKFIDPVDATFLMETDPTIFERSGTPRYYQEYTDNDTQQKRIRFYPTPGELVPVMIVGKRALIPLQASTDTPILRNIDNALIAFVTADMLERARQYGKAQAKIQEATALLEAAKALEKQQSNRPRQTKNLTVAGNSLAEMTDSVCALTGSWSPDDIILVKEFLRRNYQVVYDACFWSETAVLVRISTDGEQAVLPEYVDRVQQIRAGSDWYSLVPADQSLYFATYPGIFDQTGSPVAFSYLTPCAVKKIPTQNERLVITSASSEDDGVKIFIKGETLGAEASEAPVLPVDPTTHAYDLPLTIAKPVTVGDVEVRGETTGTLYQTILAGEMERKHIRLWLRPPNATELTLLLLGKRRMHPLVTDEDTPLLRDIQNVLINAAASDMFAKVGNKDAAMAAKEKADSALKVMLDLEASQSAQSQRVIPYANRSSYYEDDWLLLKA